MSTQRVSPLLTDLYELTMLQAYFEHQMHETAVFEFFVRKLPARRQFLITVGLEQVLQYLETLHFEPRELEILAASGRFSRAFIDWLEGFRFTGDVHAMPEGTVFFENEPTLRVTAPMPEAQFVETRIINLLQYQTLVASKAARMVLAAPGVSLVDFGLRRAHGAEAGLLAARAAYIAGFDGSSTVLAGDAFGVPTFGTVAHSFIQAHDHEADAFVNFARTQKENVVLLVDTYDTAAGVQRVVDVAPRLAAEGIEVAGIRIDSGYLPDEARAARAALDAAGLTHVSIFASGNIDEDILLVHHTTGVPIDGYGVGSALTTSEDDPHLDCAYKLQEYAGRARRKRSTGKATWPGRKQVYRRTTDGRMVGDVITTDADSQEGRPLIVPVMDRGRRVAEPEAIWKVRDRVSRGLTRLPEAFGRLERETYPVRVAPALRELAEQVDAMNRA